MVRNQREVEAEQSADDRAESLPKGLAHTAVDDEVERTGETHEGVDDEDNVVGNVIVQQFQDNTTARESVQQSDHHQWYLSQQEDGDDNHRHHGDPEGVSPLHLLSLIVKALTRVENSERLWKEY